jgi:hypothetical protein
MLLETVIRACLRLMSRALHESDAGTMKKRLQTAVSLAHTLSQKKLKFVHVYCKSGDLKRGKKYLILPAPNNVTIGLHGKSG